MDEPSVIVDQLSELIARGDTSAATVQRVVEAFASDEAWYEENPYYDGLSARGWTVELWRRAQGLITQLGEPAIALVVDRIARGDAQLLRRAAHLGPRIVAVAERALADGPAELASAASYVLACNIDVIEDGAALDNFLRAYDRYVPDARIVGDLLVETWPRFRTPSMRDEVLGRWKSGVLCPWIEARLDASEWRVRHLVALLAVVPIDEALPLLRRAFADRELTLVFEPLLVIDVRRAQTVLELDDGARAWAEPVAARIASGGVHWDHIGGEQPCDFALVEALACDVVAERLIRHLEDQTRRGAETWRAEWSALAAHVRRNMTRFERAALAAIDNQLHAAGPGALAPRQVLQIIGELEPLRMIGFVVGRMDRIKTSRNASCFVELLQGLGHPDALRHLVRWSRETRDARLREAIATAISSIRARNRD